MVIFLVARVNKHKYTHVKEAGKKIELEIESLLSCKIDILFFSCIHVKRIPVLDE
jgi:hypothetical protein